MVVSFLGVGNMATFPGWDFPGRARGFEKSGAASLATPRGPALVSEGFYW